MAFWNGLSNMFTRGDRNRDHEQQTHDQESSQVAQTAVEKFGQEAISKNPGLPTFDQAKSSIEDIIDMKSMVSNFETKAQQSFHNNYFTSLFAGMSVMPILTNKADRIRQYRAMAQYPECDFCLSELADDSIHEDEDGRVVNLLLPDDKPNLNDTRKQILLDEFDRFMELFRLRDEGYNLVKRFLTDGEVAYENIINIDKPYLGIIGVKYLPTEYYETVLNNDTGRTAGILFNKEQMDKDIKQIVSSSCVGAQAIFNNYITTGYSQLNKDGSLPLMWPQITYISSGDTSPNGLISFPLIEKCKQAYHQLALMQDAAVILRVTRAPERLLFNINTGGVPDKQARQKVLEFANQLRSKKVVSSFPNKDGNQDIDTVYNPVTMLESYFFGKSSANDGTTVESVGSEADYEQIADIEFFLRRLFKQFKVPFSRWKTPENSLERDETITYEEYSFAKMLMRIQNRFALGFKKSFITDLKLRGIWQKYNLKEQDIKVQFVRPILFDLYQVQKSVTAQMETYRSIVDQEELSKISAMKKILKMTDEEIDENFRNLIKEKQYVAMADYFGDMINEDNPPVDYHSPIKLKNQPNGGEGGESGGEEGGLGGGDLGGGSEEEPDSLGGGEEGEDKEGGEPEGGESGGDNGSSGSFGLGNDNI